jgi:hypothetical protein
MDMSPLQRKLVTFGVVITTRLLPIHICGLPLPLFKGPPFGPVCFILKKMRRSAGGGRLGADERSGMRPGMEAGEIQRLASLEGSGAPSPAPDTLNPKPSLILRL